MKLQKLIRMMVIGIVTIQSMAYGLSLQHATPNAGFLPAKQSFQSYSFKNIDLGFRAPYSLYVEKTKGGPRLSEPAYTFVAKAFSSCFDSDPKKTFSDMSIRITQLSDTLYALWFYGGRLFTGTYIIDLKTDRPETAIQEGGLVKKVSITPLDTSKMYRSSDGHIWANMYSDDLRYGVSSWSHELVRVTAPVEKITVMSGVCIESDKGETEEILAQFAKKYPSTQWKNELEKEFQTSFSELTESLIEGENLLLINGQLYGLYRHRDLETSPKNVTYILVEVQSDKKGVRIIEKQLSEAEAKKLPFYPKHRKLSPYSKTR